MIISNVSLRSDNVLPLLNKEQNFEICTLASNGSQGKYMKYVISPCSGVPRSFVRGGESTNSVEDRGQRDRGSGGGSPLVRGSGGSCNLAQEILFQIDFINFWYLRLIMMTTNLFFIANVKQLRTGGSFRILLPFFPQHLGVLAS